MVWPFRASSAVAPQSSGPGSFGLQEQLQRVSEADIAALTDDDVRRIKHTVTPEMLRAAMDTMLTENKFIVVLARSSPETWDAASREIRPAYAQAFTTLVKDRMILLYNVLPYLSEEFLTMMEDSLKPF